LNLDDQPVLAGMDDYAPASPSDWGIFNSSGSIVLDPDSMIAFERGVEYRIATYPLEKGGFQDYNKVATPFEVRVTMTKGGSVTDRQSFLNAIEALQASLDLYDVATPEKVYVGVNITRVSQSRSAQAGANLATVEILLQEVRQTVAVAYTKAATDDPPPLESQAATSTVTSKKPVTTFASGTTKTPQAAAPVNQGNVQSKAVTVSGAKLVTTTSGKQLYVYDRPIGSVH
jgi:hypothetical protein